MSTVSSIGELVDRIRIRAQGTRVGEWVVTGADWHELALLERRLPTRAELDAATGEHPVLVQRGGHVGMLNTAGLHAAGLSASEPVSGAERDEHGALTGRVEDEALYTVQALLPPPDPDALVAALAETSQRYAATGLVAVRDPAVSPMEWQAYQRVHAEGQLAVRSRAMIFTDRPGYRGELLWDRDELTEMFTVAAARGWPVGVHAFGDRAIATVLTVLSDLAADRELPRGGFVIEHGGLIDADQRRTVNQSTNVKAAYSSPVSARARSCSTASPSGNCSSTGTLKTVARSSSKNSARSRCSSIS